MPSDRDFNEALIYEAAAECPDGFVPVLSGDRVYFVERDTLAKMPIPAREKLRVVAPH